MTNQEMAAVFEDMINQWDAAKANAKHMHPEWSDEQVSNAVGNAFTDAMADR
jgi:hypothetical protein